MKIERIVFAIALNIALPLAAIAQITPEQRETILNGVQLPKESPKIDVQNVETPEINHDVEEGACPGDRPIEKHIRAHRKNNPGEPLMIEDPATGELRAFKPFTGIKSNGDGTVRLVSEPIVLQDC